MRTLLAVLTPALLLFAGCDAYVPATYEPEYVVEAYLAAGEPLPQVRLSRTAPVDTPYEFERYAVQGARVVIRRLGPDGGAVASYGYREAPGQPGVYVPTTFANVAPRETYRLEVGFGGSGDSLTDSLTAQTTVPAPISLGDVNADTAVYQSSDQFELRVRRDPGAARQAYFRFSTEALDARYEQMTPFARDLYERGDLTIEEMRRGASPILNEANYEVEDDSTLVIRYPWLGVLFFGPSRVVAYALDDNLYDFVRSQNVQQGGSTLPPGEIPNVLERVDGGTGVFGSFSSATFDVYVARPPDGP